MPEDEQAVAVAVPRAPCGACKTMRRRCVPGCIFAPYFTVDDFAAVHGVFGASNVSKMLGRIELPEQRRVAAATLIEEALARQRDPTFGRVSYIRILQELNDKARAQVDEAREEIAREFGGLAAAEPVDVAAAGAAVRAEARAQVDAALKNAREQDARLLGIRNANEARWRELHPQEGTGNHAGNGKGPDVIKRHREPSLSEQTMLLLRAAKQRSSRPPGFPNERERQQMAVAEAERKKALLMRQAAPAKQNGHHHLAAQHGETELPRVPEGYGHGQLTAAAEASREEAIRSAQAPAAARQQHLDSAGQHAGTGQPLHTGDDAAGRTPGQGSTSALREAMMQLAGATGEQQQQRLDSAGQHAGTGQPRHAGDGDAGRTPGQGSTSALREAMMQLAGTTGEQQQPRLVAQHAEDEHAIALGHGHPVDISQEMLQLQELFDMAELARNQQRMKNDVMTEMGQWDAAAGVAMEQDVMTTVQQIPANNTWQHQDPAPQYAGMRDGPQEMPQQMEEASTAELAQTTGDMSQQFAWAQQYHDPAAVHHASPWHQQMAEAHQPAAASASQVASEQDMLLLLQQHQVAAAELLSAAGGGARQFDNLAAQYDDAGLTVGFGHPDMHQQVFAAGHVAAVQDMNSRHAAAAVHAEREMMQLASSAQQQQQHRHHQQHAQNGLDIGHGNGHPDAETQAMLQELAAIVEQDARNRAMMIQQDPDVAWLVELLEKQAEARRAQKDRGITLGNGHPDGSSSTQGIQQAQELSDTAEKQGKVEMAMRRYVAAQYAREQKLEMLIMQVVEAGRAREHELITQQAAAAQQQQHPVAQYSGTELDISLGQGHGHGHGHPNWHQPAVQQVLQEKQLPTVQQMLQEQQLADAVGFGRHQHNTTSVQQDAAYANGEHRGGAGTTMAFLSPGSAKDGPFLVDQQPQPNGHQMYPSLAPLPPSLGQLRAQASHQQRTDGGGQGLNSDLAAYLHCESLSRHGQGGNGRPQQG